MIVRASILTGWTILFPFFPVYSVAVLVLGVIVMGLAFAEDFSKLRFHWKHLEILGGILVMSGMVMVLPACPSFFLFGTAPITYGQCEPSSFAAGIGFLTGVAGTLFFASGEILRRKSSAKSPSSDG